jgi:hypothetical protein
MVDGPWGKKSNEGRRNLSDFTAASASITAADYRVIIKWFPPLNLIKLASHLT